VDYFKSLLRKLEPMGYTVLTIIFMRAKEQVEGEAQPIGLMKKEHGPDASQLLII